MASSEPTRRNAGAIPAGSDPVTDEDLERGILQAFELKLPGVAKTLNAQLEERRRARPQKLVERPAVDEPN
jgi:hypothetical protein